MRAAARLDNAAPIEGVLFSGLRLNEICQLEVTDIRQIEGIACFRIASGVSETGEQKRVKTAASERIVPVHDELVRFGLLAFAESQRLRGVNSLFPELPMGHLGYRSTSLSKWFSRFLVSAAAAGPLTCFHSFRHNFRDGLREAKVDRELALVLGGWTTEGAGSAIADIYGSGYRASVLAEAINQVRFNEVDLSRLNVLGSPATGDFTGAVNDRYRPQGRRNRPRYICLKNRRC
jgi:Phage integrase family